MTQPASLKEMGEPPSWELGEFSLRPLRPGDEVAWTQYLSDPRVTEHTSFPAIDLATVADSLRRHISDYASSTSCRWALASRDDRLIGTCGFSNWSLVHSHAELVYDLAPAYWRRGYMTLAVRTVLTWAFINAAFNRVHAVVMTSNLPSVALLEKCGFTREGILRQYRLAHGMPQDFYMYSLLRAEFGAGR